MSIAESRRKKAIANFTQWNALHGIEDVIFAVTDMILAFVIFRQQLDHKLNALTAKALVELVETLEKGVRATLTVGKDGQATVQVTDEEDDDKGDAPDPEQAPGE